MTGPNSRWLALGGRVSSSDYDLWTGKLYSVALYAAPLTPSEVQTNYRAGEYNHVPVALAHTVATLEDTAVLVQLNASDPYDSVFTARITTLPLSGALYQSSEAGGPAVAGAITTVPTVVTSAYNRVWYVPAANASGVGLASFAYTMDDSEAVSAPATVTVDVSAVDDPPAVLASVAAVAAGGGATTIPGLSVAEPDGETLSLVLQADSGLLTLGSLTGLICRVGSCAGDTALMVEGSATALNAALGSLSYSTLLLASGSDTVVARVNDASGGPWAEASVAVTVTTSC